MAERERPHSLDAERALLGAVLVDPSIYGVVPDVRPRDFMRAAHAALWREIGRLSDAGVPPDFVTLREALGRSGQLEAVGGVLYISELLNASSRAANVEHYARIIREKATLRRLIDQAERTIEAAYAGDDDVDAILDQAEARLMDVGRAAVKGDFVAASDWMAAMVPALDAAVHNKRIVTGVPSGLGTLDRMTRGFQPGDLVIIAARPSVGKTALAWQIAAEASKETMCAFVSLEMSRLSVGWRAIALESRIDAFRLMTGHLAPREIQQAADALQRVGERRLVIDDSSGQTASMVAAKVRRVAARYGLGCLFVDYIQLMTSGDRTENRTLDIASISRKLKALARDLNVPVIALSQLTRENEREKRAPVLSDLREGGGLEQDADLVMFLHRPHAKEKKFAENETIELIVAKQRMGAVGTLELRWDAPTMRFADIAPEYGGAA